MTVTIRCNAIEEFNVDSKAECGQLNLAHVARKKYIEINVAIIMNLYE